jgi:predicted nucleotidyltransferase
MSSGVRASDQPDTSTLARRIVDQLRGQGVRKIILFGSRIWGESHDDSDLDVLVVVQEGEEPQTSAEKGELYRRVSKPLRDLQREWPLDLLVHSEGMHRQFRERESAFARKVLEKGEVIYGDGS